MGRGVEDMVVGWDVVVMLQDGVGVQMEREVETIAEPLLSQSV